MFKTTRRLQRHYDFTDSIIHFCNVAKHGLLSICKLRSLRSIHVSVFVVARIGTMNVLEWKIKEEWLLMCRHAFDEINRSITDQVSAVCVVRCQIRLAVPIVRNRASLEPIVSCETVRLASKILIMVSTSRSTTSGNMSIVRFATLIVSHMLVKPSMWRSVVLCMHTEVPFTKHSCIVACIFQVLRNEGLVERDAPRCIPIDDASLGSESNGVASGHQRRSGWRADRLHVVVLEYNTICSKLVKIRRDQSTSRVHKSQLVVTKVVGKNEDNVWLAGLGNRQADCIKQP
mmetsp:Transcript_97776/g.276739  ORF Transcript_97776/g.276739 Transcript_97776/m.276739 type:complete len:288 (-) Transcript_97776:69-932(-)